MHLLTFKQLYWSDLLIKLLGDLVPKPQRTDRGYLSPFKFSISVWASKLKSGTSVYVSCMVSWLAVPTSKQELFAWDVNRWPLLKGLSTHLGAMLSQGVRKGVKICQFYLIKRQLIGGRGSKSANFETTKFIDGPLLNLEQHYWSDFLIGYCSKFYWWKLRLCFMVNLISKFLLWVLGCSLIYNILNPIIL